MKGSTNGGNIEITASGLGGKGRRDFGNFCEAVQMVSSFRLVLGFKQ